MKSTILRWSVYVAIAIVFAVVCNFLSQWQFSRNEERERDIALVEAHYDAAPVPLASALGSNGTFDADEEWMPVTLTGQYLSDHEVYARNRPHAGANAFEVLVPFEATDGSVLLINRGWVPTGAGEGPDAVPAPPDGTVTVVARLRPSEQAPASGRGAPAQQVPTIHLPTVAEVSGTPIIDSAYGELVSEDPAPADPLGTFDKPTEDPGPHLSYAIQWILFAIMGFIFIVYIIRTELQKKRDEEAGREPEIRKRRDRDAADEDALLDALER